MTGIYWCASNLAAFCASTQGKIRVEDKNDVKICKSEICWCALNFSLTLRCFLSIYTPPPKKKKKKIDLLHHSQVKNLFLLCNGLEGDFPSFVNSPVKCHTVINYFIIPCYKHRVFLLIHLNAALHVQKEPLHFAPCISSGKIPSSSSTTSLGNNSGNDAYF